MTKEDIEIEACLYEDGCHNPSIQDHFVDGAEWAYKKMYWEARKAFCNTVCTNGCPQKKNNIEGGGGIIVNCDKLASFIKELKSD